MYYLMNKDRQVALLRIVSGKYVPDKKLETIAIYDRLPLGVTDLNRWVESRRAYKHNKHLEQLVKKMGGDDMENYIHLTHLTSINDTFWVKQETESITWDNVSLYRNQFTETISMLAFEGANVKDFAFSTTSPELSCDGSFRKCFRKEKTLGEFGSDIFIYKRGGEVGAGIEPYCEILASEIANHISPDNSVSYSFRPLHNKLASRCNLFTNEKTGYAPYARVINTNSLSLSDTLRYYSEIGAEQKFCEMLAIDALCFNEDRHAGNHGVLFDNDTLEIQTMAPVFDLNVALFPNAVPEDFEHIGDYMYHIFPKLGNDFTEIGQFAANNAACRDRIKDMKDFTFSFRGNKNFPPERIKCLEQIVQKQAAAILSQDKLKTDAVFFSREKQNYIEQQTKTAIAEQHLSEFMTILDGMNFSDEILISQCCSTNTVQCFVEKESLGLEIDFLKNTITPFHNMDIISNEQLHDIDPTFATIVDNVSAKWNDYQQHLLKIIRLGTPKDMPTATTPVNSFDKTKK